jgi:hypothetical protein
MAQMRRHSKNQFFLGIFNGGAPYNSSVLKFNLSYRASANGAADTITQLHL